MQLLKDLLESAGIQGDLVEKIETLFTASLKESVDAEVLAQAGQLNESFDGRLNEAAEAWKAAESEKLEAFLDHAVNEWAKTNAMAIDGTAKVQLAEKFLTGVSQLLGVGGDKVKTLDESAQVVSLQTEGAALAEQVKALTEQVAKLEAEKALSERADIVAELTEGLTDVQADRVATLAEAFATSTADAFRAKVAFLVEAVADKEGKKDPKDGEGEGKGKEGDDGKGGKTPEGEKEPKSVDAKVNESTAADASMQAYVKAITG